MSGLAVSIIGGLRRALGAAGRELRLLEEDLGLCADCAERQPPPPLGHRALRTVPAATPTPVLAQRRRVA
jgi:hypothetical protein